MTQQAWALIDQLGICLCAQENPEKAVELITQALAAEYERGKQEGCVTLDITLEALESIRSQKE